MAQNSPNWLAFAIGGGGVVGLITLIANLIGASIKSHIEGLKAQIEKLRLDNKTLERELEKKEEDSSKRINFIYETIDRLDQGKFSSRDAKNLKQVLDLLQDYKRSSRRNSEKITDCKIAGKWVESRNEVWTREATKELIREHPKLLSFGKKKRFLEEVSLHLKWVSESLSKGRPRDVGIHESIKRNVVDSPEPYVFALKYVRRKRDWGGLNPNQIGYIEKMLDEAIHRVSEQFK